MNKTVNWRAAQAYGCLDMAKFKAPGDTNVSQMAGGSYHANLHKDGVYHKPSSGGQRKRTGKSKWRVATNKYKHKIFSPVLVNVG